MNILNSKFEITKIFLKEKKCNKIFNSGNWQKK